MPEYVSGTLDVFQEAVARLVGRGAVSSRAKCFQPAGRNAGVHDRPPAESHAARC